MDHLSPQEREHYEHEIGVASEFQNAYAWSSMNRRGDDPHIRRELDAGRFVVVEEGTEYCPITDAIMGSRKFLVSAHATRAEADAAVRKYEAEHPDHDPEIGLFVLPYAPRVTPPASPADADEIPF